MRYLLECEDDIVVVADTGDVQTAMGLIHAHSPDLVLVDVSLKGLDGVAFIRQALSALPGVKVLALSGVLERSFATEILNAGALGVIYKMADFSQLLLGLREVSAGKKFLCQESIAQMLGPHSNKARAAVLGRREIQILKLIANGHTSNAISSKLFIAACTVNTHRTNIMRKLHLHNVAGLTQYAIQEGLIAV